MRGRPKGAQMEPKQFGKKWQLSSEAAAPKRWVAG